METTTSFISLFVPNNDGIIRMIYETGAHRDKDADGNPKNNLSDYLLGLIIKDLKRRSLLSESEFEAYGSYMKTKPDIRHTRLKNTAAKKKPSFALYLPQKSELSWLKKKLDTDFLKSGCGARNRSVYVWNLFVKANISKLTEAEVLHWKNYIKNKQSGKPAALKE